MAWKVKTDTKWRCINATYSDLCGGMLHKRLSKSDLCKYWTTLKNIWFKSIMNQLQLHGFKLNTLSAVWLYTVQLWKRNDLKSHYLVSPRRRWFPFVQSGSFQGFFLIFKSEFFTASVFQFNSVLLVLHV